MGSYLLHAENVICVLLIGKEIWLSIRSGGGGRIRIDYYSVSVNEREVIVGATVGC